jgi:hypothetical protein
MVRTVGLQTSQGTGGVVLEVSHVDVQLAYRYLLRGAKLGHRPVQHIQVIEEVNGCGVDSVGIKPVLLR